MASAVPAAAKAPAAPVTPAMYGVPPPALSAGELPSRARGIYPVDPGYPGHRFPSSRPPAELAWKYAEGASESGTSFESPTGQSELERGICEGFQPRLPPELV